MKTHSNNQIIADSAPALTRRSAIGSILRKGLFAGVLGLILQGNSTARAEEYSALCLPTRPTLWQTNPFEPTPPNEYKGGSNVMLQVTMYARPNSQSAWKPLVGRSVPVTFRAYLPTGVTLKTVPTDPATGVATWIFPTPQVTRNTRVGWSAQFYGDGRTLRASGVSSNWLILKP